MKKSMVILCAMVLIFGAVGLANDNPIREPPKMLPIVDIAPNTFVIKSTKIKNPQEPENVNIVAHIGFPKGVIGDNIDVSTVNLLLNGTTIQGEFAVIVDDDDIVLVQFPLTISNVRDVLGLEVEKITLKDALIEVFLKDPPTKSIDLLEVTVSGELTDGTAFTGKDALQISRKI